MFEWKGFAKFWLWFVFVVNIIALVISVVGLVGSFILGPLFIVLMLITVVLEVAIIVGVTTLLFKKKKGDNGVRKPEFDPDDYKSDDDDDLEIFDGNDSYDDE